MSGACPRVLVFDTRTLHKVIVFVIQTSQENTAFAVPPAMQPRHTSRKVGLGVELGTERARLVDEVELVRRNGGVRGSLGVMLYEMLYGTTPFKRSKRKETFYRILAKAPDLVGETTPLRGLIGKLLEKDPNQRIRLEEIKGHDFFRGIEWDLVVEIGRPPFIPETDHMEGRFQGLNLKKFM